MQLTSSSFADTLIAERARHGVNLERMAYLIGISSRTLWDWERGKCRSRSPLEMSALIEKLKSLPPVNPKSRTT